MDDYRNYTDQQLFSQISKGDEKAFVNFFYQYNSKVFYFILHIVKLEPEAEELTHDVFLKLWQSRPELDSILNPGNYLFVIARNRALDQLDKDTSRKQMLHRLGEKKPSEDNETQNLLIYKESRELVGQAVSQLPQQQRMVFQMSKEHGLSRDEIADQLHISPNTVRNHLSEAIKSIRQYLEKHGKITSLILFFYYS